MKTLLCTSHTLFSKVRVVYLGTQVEWLHEKWIYRHQGGCNLTKFSHCALDQQPKVAWHIGMSWKEGRYGDLRVL